MEIQKVVFVFWDKPFKVARKMYENDIAIQNKPSCQAIIYKGKDFPFCYIEECFSSKPIIVFLNQSYEELIKFHYWPQLDNNTIYLSFIQIFENNLENDDFKHQSFILGEFGGFTH